MLDCRPVACYGSAWFDAALIDIYNPKSFDENWVKRVSNCIFKILKIVLFSRQWREKIVRE